VSDVFDAWSVAAPLPDGARFATVEVPAEERPTHPSEASGSEASPLLRRLVLDDAGARVLIEGLRRGRQALLDRSARDVARLLGAVGARFLDPEDPLRREALARLPATAGVSAEMAQAVLDGMAADWRASRLERLLDIDLAGGAALDGFVPDRAGRLVRALGPALTLHVCAGTVSGVSVTSLIRGLLVKSAVLLKPGRGDEVLPVLFRRGLEQAAPELARAAAVVYWPGGQGGDLERVALAGAELAVVHGSDDTVAGVRARVRATTPVVSYPHRLSFGVVGAGAASASADTLADRATAAARAVALFDQRGCVSPHLFYVLGDAGQAEAFGAALAEALDRLERELPPGPPDAAVAGALHQVRGTSELLGAAGSGRMWSGGREAAWTVVLEESPTFRPSCLARVVRIKPARSLDVVLDAVRPFRHHLQTVAVAGLERDLLLELAERLARLGAVRVAPLGAAPWPPPWWNHDGVGPLAALVRWTDVEL